MNRLGLRRRLLYVVLVSVVVIVAGLVAGFNLVLARTLDQNARDLVRSRAQAELTSLRVLDGQLKTGEAPDEHLTETYLWAYSGRRPVERPRAAPLVQDAVERLVGGPRRYYDVAATDTRLYVLPVKDNGKRVGTVIAGVSLVPYEETQRTAMISSAVFGLFVLAFVGAVGWWLIGASLRPVVRMTRQAAVWSENDVDHRFALGPPNDEFTELAATLDSLLDRLAASLRRERQFSAELSHELRTPLARVLAQSELALRRERDPSEYQKTLELIHGNAAQLARIIDALMAAARHEVAGDRGMSDAEAIARGATETCVGLAEERHVEVEVRYPVRPIRVGVDIDLAERILQPVVENACRYAASRVRVAIERADSAVIYTVEDDGPGVSEDERERIFEPGARGGAARVNGSSGAGLGLSLARRLARSVAGDVEADFAPSGGRFLIKLPTV